MVVEGGGFVDEVLERVGERVDEDDVGVLDGEMDVGELKVGVLVVCGVVVGCALEWLVVGESVEVVNGSDTDVTSELVDGSVVSEDKAEVAADMLLVPSMEVNMDVSVTDGMMSET